MVVSASCHAIARQALPLPCFAFLAVDHSAPSHCTARLFLSSRLRATDWELRGRSGCFPLAPLLGSHSPNRQQAATDTRNFTTPTSSTMRLLLFISALLLAALAVSAAAEPAPGQQISAAEEQLLQLQSGQPQQLNSSDKRQGKQGCKLTQLQARATATSCLSSCSSQLSCQPYVLTSVFLCRSLLL